MTRLLSSHPVWPSCASASRLAKRLQRGSFSCRKRIGVLDRAVNEPTLHHGRNLHVEVAHFAEAVHEGGIPVKVFMRRVGWIRQGKLKGVGVVIVFEGFKVELATSKEQAMVLRAGHIGGYHVYDEVVDEHVGVDLEPYL